ncbi:hypothetical protein PVAND_012985 [Polypedilum vanderplanki]|uniref:Fibronectin type III domain-containing protein n=1 Tax=Polypedilum vanderplanki TaxID=319348 RepID=A0A9J6CP35_POLVA|nr:hypothetical protein PVAND_012985 [Polypedilum vanderplanki]
MFTLNLLFCQVNTGFHIYNLQCQKHINILALKENYDDNFRISDEDDYDSGDDEWQSQTQTVASAIVTESNLPNGYLVELKATKENNNVIMSVVNITTKPSIYDFQGSKIIVRPEEALIVILVLILWIGAISLFFHRWGKIRMLEPYIPKFEETRHRPSCPLTTLEAVATKRMSLGHMSIQCGPAWNQTGLGIGMNSGRGYRPPFSRPRLNSVFVGPHLFSPPQPPRKTKSAFDIHSLILSEAECEV